MKFIISLVIYLLLFGCSPSIVYHTVVSPSGREYFGVVEDGTIEGGKGVFKRRDLHHSYEGEFSQNKFHGQGKITYTNGDIYVGKWENGKTISQGIYYWSDGDSSIVQWYDGLPDDTFLIKAQKRAYVNQFSYVNRNIIVTIINTKVVNKFLSVELFVQNITSSMEFCLYYGDINAHDAEFNKAFLYASNRGFYTWMQSEKVVYTSGPYISDMLNEWFKENGKVFILNWHDLTNTTLSDTFIKYERIYPQSIVEKTIYGTFQPAQQPVYDLPSTGLDVGLTWKVIFDISKFPENQDKYELFFDGNVIEIQNTE